MATTTTKSAYVDYICTTLATLACIGMLDPRHIEAYMRLEHSTLDALSAEEFRSEVALAADCIRASGTAEAELLAESYGL